MKRTVEYTLVEVWARIALAVVAALAAMAVAVSCNGPETLSDEETFAEMTDVCILVGYKQMIDFSKGDLQYSFNNTKNIYRAGVTQTQRDEAEGIDVQTVQEYYVLRTEKPLGEAGEAVAGQLVLCSGALSSGMRSYDIKDGKVLKTGDGLVWIWDSEIHLGLVVAVK